MKVKGKISKIHSDLNFGMVTVPKHGKIFFSSETVFGNSSFDEFKTDDDVELEFVETERGLFAKSLSKTVSKSKFQPEAVV
jgi:hypothetical protein